jgi:hypothetical protein
VMKAAGAGTKVSCNEVREWPDQVRGQIAPREVTRRARVIRS